MKLDTFAEMNHPPRNPFVEFLMHLAGLIHLIGHKVAQFALQFDKRN